MIDKIAKFSAIQSIVETGLGAWLHALRVPLSGQILSLNQGFLLTLASRRQPRIAAVQLSYGVSSVSALLKSFSPIGKRLTPMLAIWMQGLLFSMGVFFAGSGMAGVILGMLLLSLWSFIQPVLFAWLLFGSDPLSEWVKLFPSAVQSIGWVVGVVVFLKLLVATILAVIGHSTPDVAIEKYQSIVQHSFHPVRAKKFGQWIWIVGTVAMGLCLFFIKNERTVASFSSYVLRPLAVGLVLFYGLGMILKKVNWEKFSQSFPIIGASLVRVKRDLSSNN